MKIIDIAKNLDKSRKNECYIDFDALAEELGIHNYGYVEQDPRLKAYWVETWYCTDSWVGGRMYFFDDEPVAYSYQTGRKNDEVFHWFSQEAAEKVQAFVRELTKEELQVNICDVNEDIGDTYKINYAAQVLDWSMARLNGQPIEFIERVRPLGNYGFDTDVKIRVPDTGEEMIVNVRDLDFLFHVNAVPLMEVDEVLAEAAERSGVSASLSKQADFEKG